MLVYEADAIDSKCITDDTNFRGWKDNTTAIWEWTSVEDARNSGRFDIDLEVWEENIIDRFWNFEGTLEEFMTEFACDLFTWEV